MLDRLDVLLLSLGYLLGLFGIAYLGDRVSTRRMDAAKPLIISLALTIYCSAWSFYGNTSQAVYNGWYFPPTFLGAIITLIVGGFMLRRLISVSKQYNITSVADFIASQFGRSQPLAVMVTVVALIALLPYISLQLKAISESFHILTVTTAQTPRELLPDFWLDNTFYIALILALFTVMFGTRHIDSKEQHNGLMVAIAFESMVKLASFCAVAYYVCFQLFDGAESLVMQTAEDGYVQQIIQSRQHEQGFFAAMVLGMAAIICLPRQFHTLVVESKSQKDLHTARWVLPLYLTLFAAALLPIAYAGLVLFQGQGISPEQYILRLPLNNDNHALALFAYIGGLSAGSSMVIVACVAISTMICNEIVMPILLRRHWLGVDHRGDLSNLLRIIRRSTIFVVLILAYCYYRWLGGYDALGAIGLLALALVAQFAPAIVAALYWRHGHANGVMAGITAGFIVWGYTLLLPTLAHAGWVDARIINLGPWGISWLRPQTLFNFEELAPISNGVLWSLLFNLLVFIGVSLLCNRSTKSRLATVSATPITTTQLQTLAARFLGREQAQLALCQFPDYEQKQLHQPRQAEPAYIEFVENLLAGVISSASARHVIEYSSQLARDGSGNGNHEENKLLDETSQIFQFGRGLLQSSIDNISQGISVIDQNQQLVAWNKRYLEMFDYPEGMIHVGRPVADLVRYNAERGDCGPGNIDTQIEKRLQHLRLGTPYVFQRTRRDGTVLEIRGNPVPGGGFVTTYTDISDYTRIVSALKESKQHLEQRVDERTSELTQANRQLRDADENKTRFLAAAGHDLIQPLNASKLFITALQQRELSASDQALIDHLASSIHSAESLISELLDIAKLDAGAVQPNYTPIPVNNLLESLSNDYRVQAEEKGLVYHCHTSSAIINSDSTLLRRILQNLLANAIRYTDRGRVVIGCRREQGSLRIEVWDTGIGIPESQHQEIFVEFKRLRPQQHEEGTGLGLATVQRLCRLLGIPLELRSIPNQGSVFAVTLPLLSEDSTRIATGRAPAAINNAINRSLESLNVVCIDNEKKILQGMDALLGGWGCQVNGYTGELEVKQASKSAPDVVLADYHLDHDANGIDAVLSLYRHWDSQPPCIIISADRTDAVKTEALEKGFYFLRKPIKPAALRALLTRLMIKANNQRAAQ